MHIKIDPLFEQFLQDIETYNCFPISKEQEIGLGFKYQKSTSQKRKFARDNLIKSNLQLIIHLAKKIKNTSIPLIDLISIGNEELLRTAQNYEPERGLRFATYAGSCAYQKMKGESQKLFKKKTRLFSEIEFFEKKIKEIRPRSDLNQIQEIDNRLDVFTIINKINEKDKREMIERRYGINGYKGSTYEEIGKSMQYSREHIRKSIISSLENLRKCLK